MRGRDPRERSNFSSGSCSCSLAASSLFFSSCAWAACSCLLGTGTSCSSSAPVGLSLPGLLTEAAPAAPLVSLLPCEESGRLRLGEPLCRRRSWRHCSAWLKRQRSSGPASARLCSLVPAAGLGQLACSCACDRALRSAELTPERAALREAVLLLALSAVRLA